MRWVWSPAATQNLARSTCSSLNQTPTDILFWLGCWQLTCLLSRPSDRLSLLLHTVSTPRIPAKSKSRRATDNALVAHSWHFSWHLLFFQTTAGPVSYLPAPSSSLLSQPRRFIIKPSFVVKPTLQKRYQAFALQLPHVLPSLAIHLDLAISALLFHSIIKHCPSFKCRS